MLPRQISAALKRLDHRLLETVEHEARRAAQLAGGGETGWDGVRNLTRPSADALMAAAHTLGPLVPAEDSSGFARIVSALSIHPMAADVLLVLLAPFVEPRYQTLYAMLQDDPKQPFATERLLLSVLAASFERRRELSELLSPGSSLVRSGFVAMVPQTYPAPLRQAYSLPQECAAFFLGTKRPAPAGLHDMHWDEGEGQKRDAGGGQTARIIAGRGDCEGLARHLLPAGQTFGVAEFGSGTTEEDARGIAAALWRLGVVSDTSPVLDLRRTGSDASLAAAGEIVDLCRRFGGSGLCLVADPLPLPVPHIRCPPTPWSKRLDQWDSAARVNGLALSRKALGGIASRHRLEGAEIHRAVAYFAGSAGGVEETDRAKALDAMLRGATRSVPKFALGRHPNVTLDDLVLRPATRNALERLCFYVDNRDRIAEAQPGRRHFQMDRGPVALFHGRPGTGKTVAAEALVAALNRPFFVVDLSQILSKYVGETEKHINDILLEAERAGALILFDEAETLFARRVERASSGGEQFNNMVVGFILQRIEQHDGPVVLATNLAQALDEAMMRRFRFRIEFPLPDPDERARIWSMMLGAECAATLDLPSIGRQHKLSGGEIRNAAMKAVMLADERGQQVDAELLEESIRLELFELGRLSSLTSSASADEPSRGALLREAGNGLQSALEAHLRNLFLKEIHVLEGAPTERHLSGYRPALSVAMFSLAGRRGGEALRIGFVVSAWSNRAEEEHELLGVAHAFLSTPPKLTASGRQVTLRLQESHDFELLQRFWSSHDQPLKPSIVLDAEVQ